MKSIWLYFDVTCSLNNFSWNVDVKPSKSKKPPSNNKPYTLLDSSSVLEIGPVIKNSVTPPVTAAAINQSVAPYIVRNDHAPDHDRHHLE